jgi:hypothetical protein
MIVDVYHQGPEDLEDLEEAEEETPKQGSIVKGAQLLEEDGGDDAEEECLLTEDIYSLICISSIKSQAFFFAMATFGFQMAMTMLVCFDIIDVGVKDSDNPIRIPGGVEATVTAAQALALVLAVATQGDVITALEQLHGGYRYGKDEVSLEITPSATFLKWLLSAVCQLCAGCVLLMATFILIMQSDNVIGMMLNFAALSFISEIDDIAFALANKGFVTDSVQKETKNVAKCVGPAKQTSNIFRRVLYLAITGGLLAGYGVIVKRQRAGKYLTKSLFIQYSDDLQFDFSFFSGLYVQTGELVQNRVTYVDEATKTFTLAYCGQDEAWTFTDTEENSACEFVYAKSEKTNTFDVTTIPAASWLVEDSFDTEQIVPFAAFTLKTNDCSEDLCRNEHGTCKDNVCVCNKDRYGLNCEFAAPCPELLIDQRTNGFPVIDAGTSFTAETYQLLKNAQDEPVEVYNRPVYVSTDESSSQYRNVMFFLGRRWAITDTFELATDAEKNMNSILNSMEDIAQFFDETSFHGFYNTYKPFFMSDPMDYGTSSDSLTPTGLAWNNVRTITTIVEGGLNLYQADSSIPLTTVLQCKFCDKYEIGSGCLNNGVCDETNICSCFDDTYFGALCESQLTCLELDGSCYNGGTCTASGVCQDCVGARGLLCEVPFE